MKIRVVFLFAAYLYVLNSTMASAADFTFKVPLQIQNIPEDINNFKLVCNIFGLKKDGTHGQIGSGETFVILNRDTGNPVQSSTPMVIEVNASQNLADPRDAESYNCKLLFAGGSGISKTDSHVDATKPFQTSVQGQLSFP